MLTDPSRKSVGLQVGRLPGSCDGLRGPTFFTNSRARKLAGQSRKEAYNLPGSQAPGLLVGNSLACRSVGTQAHRPQSAGFCTACYCSPLEMSLRYFEVQAADGRYFEVRAGCGRNCYVGASGSPDITVQSELRRNIYRNEFHFSRH